MHDYSIDRHPKAKVVFFLAFLAITVAPQVQSWVQELVKLLEIHQGWSSPPVVAIPVFSMFAGFYWLFDRVLWKSRLPQKVMAIPNLNGKWTCKGTTTLKEGDAVEWPWEGTITISQTWSKILIHLQTQSSESRSISASLFQVRGVGFRLLYQYSNDPKANQHELNKHSGATELLFSTDSNSASGHYYSDNHRQTVGTMNLRKENGNEA